MGKRKRIKGPSRHRPHWKPFDMDAILAEIKSRPPDPERDARINAYLARREEEERMLASMSPEQREAWIREWAKQMAEQEVRIGCEIDAALKRGDLDGAVKKGLEGFPCP